MTGTRRSAAQMFALVAGAALTVGGVVGFFYSSAFGSPGKAGDVFGVLSVNGWHNLVHIFTGVFGLSAAASYGSARMYSLVVGLAYVAIAVWGFAVGSGHALLSIIPVNTEDNVLHLLIGVAGLAAGMATPAAKEPTAVRPVPA